jgi:hypothetical protein
MEKTPRPIHGSAFEGRLLACPQAQEQNLSEVVWGFLDDFPFGRMEEPFGQGQDVAVAAGRRFQVAPDGRRRHDGEGSVSAVAQR